MNKRIILGFKPQKLIRKIITEDLPKRSIQNMFYTLIVLEKALNQLDLGGDRLFNISDRQYKKLFKSTKQRSGLHVTAKSLRDWFCCEMGSLGVSDRYIDAFCGRTPKSVLARHYTDYLPGRLRKIYEEANLKILT